MFNSVDMCRWQFVLFVIIGTVFIYVGADVELSEASYCIATVNAYLFECVKNQKSNVHSFIHVQVK